MNIPLAVTVRGYVVASVLVLLIAGAVYLVRRYWPWRQAPAPPETRPEIDEPPADRHVRTPSDVLRLIIGVLLVLIGLLFATGASNTLVGFERDLISAFDTLPEVVARVINLLAQGFASIAFTAILVVALWRRRVQAVRDARRDVPVRAGAARGPGPGHRAAVSARPNCSALCIARTG